MYLKKITINDHIEVFDEKNKLILIADESGAFSRAISVLFQTSRSNVGNMLQTIGYEAVAYGHTIERKLNGKHTSRLTKSVLRHKIVVDDVTIAPQKLDLPLPIRRYARRDYYCSFYDLFFGQLSFFPSKMNLDYYSFAQEIWYDDVWYESKYGLGKGAWKKACTAANAFNKQDRWTVPEYCKHSRVAELIIFFEGNALMKSACDAIGKECPPLFITNALSDMLESDIAVVINAAKKSGLQTFFIESEYKEWLRPFFDDFHYIRSNKNAKPRV